MSRPRPRLLACFVLLAVAVGQPQAASQTGASLGEDARLSKRVTVDWSKTTLYEALKEVSKQTGVYVTPERARVDEPLMAAAGDLPAHELLTQIARLFNYTWVRSGGSDQKPNYLLYQTKRAAAEEEALVNEQLAAVMVALQKEVENYRKLGALPPDQLQAQVEQANKEFEGAFKSALSGNAGSADTGKKIINGMAVRTLGAPAGRAMLNLLNGLTPSQWQSLVQDGAPIVYSTQPAAGELAMPGPVSDLLRSHEPEFPFPTSALASLGPQVQEGLNLVTGMMRSTWSRASGFRATIELNISGDSIPMGILRVTPEPMVSAGEQGDLPREAVDTLFGLSGINMIAVPQSLMEETKRSPEEEALLAADPVLGKKVRLELPPPASLFGIPGVPGTAYRLAEVLPLVQASAGIPIVADAYNRQVMNLVTLPERSELPLYQLLDKMAGSGRAWTRDGGAIRIRSKTWAFDRRGEIPLRYMQRWLAVRDKRGYLELDDMAEIASLLRDAQVDSLMFAAMEAGGGNFTDFAMITQNRDILRFWHTLLPIQRQQLRRGAVLAARSLFPHQKRALLLQTARKNRSITAMFTAGGGRSRPASEYLAAAIAYEEANPNAQANAPGGAATARPAPRARVSISAGPGDARANAVAASTVRVCTVKLKFPDSGEQSFTIPIMKRETRAIPPASSGLPSGGPGSRKTAAP